MKSKIAIITGHGASGTTALAKVCQNALNGKFFIEMAPKLCYESRDLYEENIDNSEDVIYTLRNELFNKRALQSYDVIGDKNQNYMLFSEDLVNIWNAKILFVLRSPIEVIKSALNHGSSLDIKTNGGHFELSEDKYENTARSKYDDWWDYSRFRPTKKENCFRSWKSMTKLEKTTWSLNRYNALMFEMINKLPKENVRIMLYEKFTTLQVKQVYDFFGLTGFDSQKISDLIEFKVNSYSSSNAGLDGLEMFSEEQRFNIEEQTSWIIDKYKALKTKQSALFII